MNARHISMTLLEFNKILADRHQSKALHDVDGHVNNDIMEIYAENRKELNEEFFVGIGHRLDRDDFSGCREYLGLLTVSPFGETDHERFQRLTIRSIEKLENTEPSYDFSQWANFVWMLLDHMLHHWAMSDEKLMKERLLMFKEKLSRFEARHRGDVDLLYQKLDHFGVQ